MRYQQFLVIFFESVSVFMCLFFLLQYLIIKRKEHLFYALFLLALSVYYPLALPDFFFDMQAENSVTVEELNIFKRPIQFLSSVFYTLFVIYYLGLAKKSAYLFRFFRMLIVLYLSCFVVSLGLNLAGIDYDNVYYLFSMLLFPIQMYVVAALFKHKVAYSKYIIFGSIITLIGSATSLILSIYVNTSATQQFDRLFNIFLPVQISMALDMFLFTIALQKKIADNEKSLINAAFLRQQAIMLERERIITDLHDDVGGGISSIRMMSDLMAQRASTSNDTGYAAFPQKISNTAKEIAQRMHTIIWSLNEENDTLANFTEYVRHYGMDYFEDSGIQFSLTHSPNLSQHLQLSGVQRKNCFLVIKEALHNILKHAHAKQAIIDIKLEHNRLSIRIEDDGVGIHQTSLPAGNGYGNGLKNMKKRMEEIHGELHYESAKGTHIQLLVTLEEK